MKTLLAALAATALLAGACSPRMDPAAAEPAGDPATQVQTVAAEAAEAGRAWGRKHLGHYIDMTAESLTEEGFAAPANVTVTVEASHMEFCVVATHTDLPADHPWHAAAMTSRSPKPFADDDCGL